MVTFRALLWIWLAGWLWMQPALALHQLESLTPDHSHLCQVCAAHLDGKSLPGPTPPLRGTPAPPPLPDSAAPEAGHADVPGHYTIRAPPADLNRLFCPQSGPVSIHD
ncbi:hypothetical protein [Aeromonas simiae]|uniref:hypothetical protein n=1 Tax=Aeromonas simiae TaxID=218936 RepID=UPI0005AAF9DC|nr:hypothetical protein [Aeromonas simiae]MDO2949716.1 hypothetical protein [Aeromonas simiae]MDO2953389.1 hypothetical protein [Aeromonas simiae]MDO2957047.1 hypothetical protein [Aeromonas simiae]